MKQLSSQNLFVIQTFKPFMRVFTLQAAQMRCVALLLLAFMLSACQNLPGLQGKQQAGGTALQKNSSGQFVSNDFEAVQQYREKISAWQLRGSFSYVDPEETGAGRIQWSFQGNLLNSSIENESVRLVGPIGTGSLELISSDSSASLIAGKNSHFGADVESLLLKVIGWRLPVNELRYWLFGMPSTTAGGRYWLNDQGLLQSLQQSDWEIQFDRYQSLTPSSPLLPQKITAIHRGNQAKVKLVIKQLMVQ